MPYGQRRWKMGKVLNFPTNYKPDNPPEVDTKAAETRENFAWCEQLAEGLTYGVLLNLQKNGVNIVNEETIIQLSFLGECIKSVVYNERDIQHPLQDLAARFITLEKSTTNKGEPAIKGNFDVLMMNEWMEQVELSLEDDEPDPPIAV